MVILISLAHSQIWKRHIINIGLTNECSEGECGCCHCRKGSGTRNSCVRCHPHSHWRIPQLGWGQIGMPWSRYLELAWKLVPCNNKWKPMAMRSGHGHVVWPWPRGQKRRNFRMRIEEVATEPWTGAWEVELSPPQRAVGETGLSAGSQGYSLGWRECSEERLKQEESYFLLDYCVFRGQSGNNTEWLEGQTDLRIGERGLSGASESFKCLGSPRRSSGNAHSGSVSLGGTWDSAFPTCSLVMLMLLGCGPWWG